jgi:hypothetical protein
LVAALTTTGAGKLPDVAADWALHDLGRIAKQSLDENKRLYCWTSL